MKVVVDTNVLVSSFLSSQGSPSEVLRMIMSGRVRICYDMRILNEYSGVLERPKFRISHALSAQFLDQVRATGESISASPLSVELPDPSDMAFLEVALTAQAECLITGNLKHFPTSCRHGVLVFSPAEFLQYYRKAQDSSSGPVKSSSEEYCSSKNKKNKTSSLQGVRPVSFVEFKRSIDGTRVSGEVDWTPAEVEKVIRSIRRKKYDPKQAKGPRKTSRHSDITFRATGRKSALLHLNSL